MKTTAVFLLNIKSFRKKSVKTVLALFIILTCSVTFLECKAAADEYLLQTLNLQASAGFVGFRDDSDLRADLSACEYKGYADLNPFPSVEQMKLIFEDGTGGMGTETYDYYFAVAPSAVLSKETYRVNCAIRLTDIQGCVFSEKDAAEFEAKFPGERLLLAGSLKLGDGDILISDYMLSHFGFTEKDYDRIIGQRVVIGYAEAGQNVWNVLKERGDVREERELAKALFDTEGSRIEGVLKGVYNSDIHRTEANKSAGHISVGKKTENGQPAKKSLYRLYYGENFSDTYRLGEEFLNAGGAIYFTPMLEKYHEVEMIRGLLRDVGGKIVLTVMCLIACNLCIHLYFCSKRSVKNNAMLFALGYTRRGVLGIICTEYLTEALVAGVLALTAVFGMRTVFAAAGKKLVGAAIKAKTGTVLLCFAEVYGAVLLFLLLFAFLFVRRLTKENVCNLLNGGE